jgi:RNase H-like domain found in reverse transcriptase
MSSAQVNWLLLRRTLPHCGTPLYQRHNGTTFLPRPLKCVSPICSALCSRRSSPDQLAGKRYVSSAWSFLSSQQMDAFNTLRDKLLSPPVLALPRATGKMWLDTDTSDGQLGTCLLQEHINGQTLQLRYWSRTLNPAERNYSTTEK